MALAVSDIAPAAATATAQTDFEVQISGLTKETYTVRCAQANNVDFSLRTFVDFTFTTRDEMKL